MKEQKRKQALGTVAIVKRVAGRLFVMVMILSLTGGLSPFTGFAGAEASPITPAGPIVDAPIMGWNSFDSFYDSTDLNEANVKAVADYMAANMKDSGYLYINLDGGWWNNQGGSGVVLVDEYGRPVPGAVRFPSANADADGDGRTDGLKPLADYIHSEGLKLGIYATRGIPRAANNSAVTIEPGATAATASATGQQLTRLTGAQITNINDICAWSNDNYGLNWDDYPNEALAYYVSLFQLWEDWGVDLIKIDDLNDSTNAKYTAYPNGTPPYRQADIEGYAKAREIAGSDIVINGSPGRGLTGERVDNILSQLDTMRASADVWDTWADVNKLFTPAKDYAQYTYTKPGKYMDLDMLPFGTLKDKTNNPYRSSKLTKDEAATSMTLHLIARSPIIMGGVLYKLDMSNEMDQFTFELLTNKEAIAVNQEGTNQKSFYDAGNITKWVSDAADGSKYVALFNRNGSAANINFEFADPEIGLAPADTYNVRDLWAKEYVGSFTGSYSINVPAHGAMLYKVIPATDAEAIPAVSIATPGASVPAGESTTITTTLTNSGIKNVSNVTVNLEVPGGWSAVHAAGNTRTIASLAVGQSKTIQWQIHVPDNAAVTDNIVTTKVQFADGGTSYNKQISTPFTVIPAVIPEGFSDDFSNGKTSWTDTGAGTWTVADESGNKVLKQTASTAGTSTTRNEYRTSVTGRTWMDAIYEVDVRYDGVSRSNDLSNWSTLMFKKAAQDNSFRQDTYYLYWRINGQLTLVKGAAGTILGTYQAPALSTATTASSWHHLKVANIGNRIQVYIDNNSTPVIDAADSSSPLTTGYAGLGASSSAWSFDNFSVRVEGDLVQPSGAYDLNSEKADDPDNVIKIPVVLFNKTVWNTYLIDSEGKQIELGLNDGDDYEVLDSNYVKTYKLTRDLLSRLEKGTYTFRMALSDAGTVDYTLTIMDTTSRAPVTNTAGSAVTTYDGNTINLAEVSGLFDVDSNAGERTFSIEAGGAATGEGAIAADHKTLTVTKPGTFIIGLVTAKTATHEAGEKVNGILTVNKGNAFAQTYNIDISAADTSEGTLDVSTLTGAPASVTNSNYTLGAYTDSEGILNGNPSLSGTTLTYQGTAKLSGTATQLILLKSDTYADSTITITFTATPADNTNPNPATGAPGTPVLSDNNGQDTGLRDGDYTVTMNLWWGNNGTRFKLYEDGNLIKEVPLADQSPSAQAVRIDITGKKNGTYVYTGELSNSLGTTKSSPLTVAVMDASPGQAVLSSDNWDGDGNYNVSMNLWWGTNATEYVLYENGTLVETQTLEARSPGAQSAVTVVSGKAPGIYEYEAVLRNPAGETKTLKMTVKVQK
ncbi:NEW3 domain-containing protein [Paenibacillus sp. FSL L8-0470]|uniref:NEW3 domain-containing protein n=1 Tax=Paenibacillus sp. FSL L8-0470 TaxID=2954688 RepID=UPI0030F9AE37